MMRQRHTARYCADTSAPVRVRFGRLRALCLAALAALTAGSGHLPGGQEMGEGPNLVVIFADDLGYGDIGPFGSWIHRTPHLDRMAAEGMRFTSFYVTSGVCTPSRASLMTGSYPRRVGMHVNGQSSGGRQVLFPVARRGLHPAEATLADVLKQRGYHTMAIGKWHLGDQAQFLPTRQGFEHYFGIPYSNDMQLERRGDPPLPLMRDEVVIEAPVDQNTLTARYTEEATRFIREHAQERFFLYLAHSMPHNPTHASDRFRGRSANGRYGDSIEEIDWSAGRILNTIEEMGLAERTLVVFTSDNGAADRWGGTNAPLRGFKASTMEGGMRVPMIAWWPGTVPAESVTDELATTMDVLPTVARLAGAALPADRPIDGHDIAPLLRGLPGARSPYEAFFYYQKDQLQAVRSGRWKLHLPLEARIVTASRTETAPSGAFLVDLSADISENTNVASAHPDVVKHLLTLADSARAELGDGDDTGRGQRPAGEVDDPKPLLKEEG